MPVLMVSLKTSPQLGFSRNWVIWPSSLVIITPYSRGLWTWARVRVAIGFGRLIVSGRSLDPSPPAMTTAFMRGLLGFVKPGFTLLNFTNMETAQQDATPFQLALKYCTTQTACGAICCTAPTLLPTSTRLVDHARRASAQSDGNSSLPLLVALHTLHALGSACWLPLP